MSVNVFPQLNQNKRSRTKNNFLDENNNEDSNPLVQQNIHIFQGTSLE